jgi:hypothetical protein
VNETVKFLWKYYVKNTDVDIKWGTSKHISPKVSTFDKIFFSAIEYEKYRNPQRSSEMPDRYRGRVQIVGQASLQIVNVTLEDEGEYLCEISDTGNAWKTLSRAAMLHVLGECVYINTVRFFNLQVVKSTRVYDCYDECKLTDRIHVSKVFTLADERNFERNILHVMILSRSYGNFVSSCIP